MRQDGRPAAVLVQLTDRDLPVLQAANTLAEARWRLRMVRARWRVLGRLEEKRKSISPGERT